MAQKVTVDAAKGRALDFLTKQSIGPKHAKGTINSTDLSLAYTSSSEGKTCFYVFNIGDDNGFVIAGGDESARQILGYSDHGSFDYDTAPDNLRWWLSQYTEQIARAAKAGVTDARRAKAAMTPKAPITPLIEAKWNQREPYNKKIVADDNATGFVTGCVATAMAQVMRKWECPTQGKGSHSYTGEEHTFSANFGATTYEWNNMPYIYDNYSEAQANAVATLMFHAGVSVDMEYGTDESSANSFLIGYALATYFGYDKAVRNEFRQYYTDEEWEELVYQELSAGRPVLYSGQAQNGGHQFICDGYSDGYFTINWGWGGNGDGGYLLTGTGALKPNVYGIGSGGEGSAYTGRQMITIGVMPNQGGSESIHLVQNEQSDLNIDNQMYLEVGSTIYDTNYEYTHSTSNQAFYLYSTYQNMSCLITKFNLGVKAVEQTTGICYYWKSDSDELGNGYYYEGPQPFVFYPNQLTYNGVYELRPVCRKEGGTDADWTEIDILTTETYPTLTVTGATDPDPVDITFSVEENTVQVARTLQITHNSNYNGAVSYSSSNQNVATVDDNGLITGVSVGSATITAHGQPEGFYNETTTTFNITVTELVKEDVTFTISNTCVMQNKTLQISWNENYDGTPVFSSSDESIATVDGSGVVTGISDGTVTITATAPATTFFNENMQQFTIKVVSEGIVMVEEPYFNNDNNLYEDDFVLHFKIMNATSETTPINLYCILEAPAPGSGTYNMSLTYPCGEVASGEVLPGTFDFSTLPQDIKQYFFIPNVQCTIYFYKDEAKQEAYEYASILYTYRNKRTIGYGVSPAGYGTLVLPFNADLPADLTAYSCSGVDNDVLILQEENSIKRNVPYIVKGTPDKTYTFVGPDAIDSDDQIARVNNDDIFIGALGSNVPLAIGTDYIMQVHGDAPDAKAAFYRYMGAPANPIATQFRAFLRFPSESSSQAPKINFPGNGDDETEGISTLSTDTLPAGIYTLDGHRQSSFQKGLNILIFEDGTAQKVFVK